MNKPDENTLNRWLLGELEGEELCRVNAWAEENASDLDSEFKCDIGWDALGASLIQEVPASIEPPYPEFFNHKLLQAIQAEEAPDQHAPVAEPASAEPGVSIWQKLRWMVLPTAVAAGVAFYAGAQMRLTAPHNGSRDVATTPAPRQQVVYTPDGNVVAAVSESEGATEIVLVGLKPISDELDIVKAETSSLARPPFIMVAQPEQPANQVTFF